MSVSAQTRGSVIEQLVWGEHKIAELEEQLYRCRARNQKLVDSLKALEAVYTSASYTELDALRAERDYAHKVLTNVRNCLGE